MHLLKKRKQKKLNKKEETDDQKNDHLFFYLRCYENTDSLYEQLSKSGKISLFQSDRKMIRFPENTITEGNLMFWCFHRFLSVLLISKWQNNTISWMIIICPQFFCISEICLSEVWIISKLQIYPRLLFFRIHCWFLLTIYPAPDFHLTGTLPLSTHFPLRW